MSAIFHIYLYFFEIFFIKLWLDKRTHFKAKISTFEEIPLSNFPSIRLITKICFLNSIFYYSGFRVWYTGYGLEPCRTHAYDILYSVNSIYFLTFVYSNIYFGKAC